MATLRDEITKVITPKTREGRLVALKWMAGIFITAGVLLVASGVVIGFERRSTDDWVKTTGFIVRYNVYGGSGRNTYEIDLGVNYIANGRALRATRLSVAGNLVSYRETKKYKLGDEVDVYYDPDNPSDAVLDRTAYLDEIKRHLCAGFLIWAGAFCNIHGKKMKAETEEVTHEPARKS